MSEFLTSRFGDKVAYDHRGTGPAVLFIAGAGPWRAIDPETTHTAEIVAAAGLTSIVYDRVGRGESRAAAPIALEREIAAVEALLEKVGSAILCGHSSGCALALVAASMGLPAAGLVLWEAPLAPPASGAGPLADELRALIDDGQLSQALDLYMQDMPPEILDIVRSIPAMIDQAASLQPDADALAWAESGALADLLSAVRVPTLSLLGTTSYDEIMVPAAEAIVGAIPGAEWRRVAGADHQWEAAPMAAEIVRFAQSCWR